MDLMEKLDKKEIREFFSKNWMTHDAMWFGSVMRELGAEKANEINKILKLMDKPKDAVITTFEELKEIIDAIYTLNPPEGLQKKYDEEQQRSDEYSC